jgi:hypothetical protein
MESAKSHNHSILKAPISGFIKNILVWTFLWLDWTFAPNMSLGAFSGQGHLATLRELKKERERERGKMKKTRLPYVPYITMKGRSGVPNGKKTDEKCKGTGVAAA